MRTVVAITCLLLSLSCRGGATTDYALHSLDRGEIIQTVSATGEVTARSRVSVGSQVSGLVSQVHVDFNAKVARGDVLAELEPRLFAAQLARSEAAVAVAAAEAERAQVQFADAQRTWGRHRKLLRDDMVATATVDQTQVQRDLAAAAVKSAAAAVQQAKADRDQAAANLALTKIRSPIDGIVIDRQVEVGQTVAAQFQVATLFVVVGDLQQLYVIVNIDEADVARVRPGMPVDFHVDAYPQHTFPGTLESLRQAPAAATTPGAGPPTGSVVTYAAIVAAANPNAMLLQGMTAQARIVVAQRQDVVRLPPAALRFVPDDAPAGAAVEGASSGTAATSVYVLTAGVPERRSVSLGITDGRYVEVTAGLAAGDAVIVGQSAAQKRWGHGGS